MFSQASCSYQSSHSAADRKGTKNVFLVSTLQLGQQERELLLPSVTCAVQTCYQIKQVQGRQYCLIK